MNDEKTPLEIAGEVWPLEWKCTRHDPHLLQAMLGDVVVGVRYLPEQGAWVNLCSFGDGPELSETLRQVRERITQVAAPLPSYPVQVVRHRETGEAVLMLTCPTDDGPSAWPLAARLLRSAGVLDSHRSAEFGAILNFTTDPDRRIGHLLPICEPAEDIRATLVMLAEERGGEV